MTELNEIRQEARRNTRARFEQWAKNPKCEANTISAVHNVRLDKAAEAAGITPSFGQSPFAIARGDRFEASLFYDDASRLRAALERRKLLPDQSEGFLDLRLRMNGGADVVSVDDALTRTSQWLERLAAGDDDATIVAAPMIRIPRGVILPEALLIIDAAVVREVDGVPQLTVGEVKVFPDRGGHTDPAQLASARAQAGLYRRAMELTLEAAGLENQIAVDRTGFLVFTWPGSNMPAVRANEDLTYQAIRAERGFARLEEVAHEIVRDEDFSADNAQLVDRVLHAPTSYSEACLSFCDLAPRCFERALKADLPIVLGAEAHQLLAGLTISRALELLHGAAPESDREADLQRQLVQA